ncbi:LGFP repeat-containing protein, partial [Porphyromonas gulae]|uniref:LGFP repeat-containing protein n=2 Tax=Porphyromonas gulae TaxID=111105 RepID=UPI00057D2A4B
MSAIDEKYKSLGGENGFLGAPVCAESNCPDNVGRYRHCQKGSIYWHPDTGAHEMHGDIYAKYAKLGWERSILGYPTTDERATPDGAGRYNH